MGTNKTNSIDNAVRLATEQYNELMQSDYIAKTITIDGVVTRGQIQDNKRQTTTKEEQTKTVATKIDTKVKRGSYVEIQEDSEDSEYILRGVVSSIPNRTPVDYYYTVLLFNTDVTRKRTNKSYDEYGYVIDDNPDVVDKIPCFVQRVSMRQRQVDAGIDRDSVNEIITTKNWDIKIGDILHIGKDTYKINDIEELDKELFIGYMAYYRI